MAMNSINFFEDEHFQNALVKLLAHDVPTLRKVAPLLNPDDFKPQPGMRWGRPRWLVADRILAYYSKHQDAIGRLLRAEFLDFAKQSALSPRQLQEVEDYIKHLKTIPIQAPEALTEKVLRFKQEIRQSEALDELHALSGAGALTEAKWLEITHRVLNNTGAITSTDFFENLANRLERRRNDLARPRAPLFLIDPLDAMVRGVAPGELGTLLAPYGRGKSMALMTFALSFALQRIPSLYFTLEDPAKEVEDRMDAAITRLPVAKLADTPRLLENRFLRHKRFVSSRIRIVDGTDNGFSVQQMEQIYLRERDSGFRSGAWIIDYDDEIVPATKNKDRRFELSDIYRDLRRAAARNNQIIWTAAQTQRNTNATKFLGGDKVAEDISKIRKSTMAIGLGQGDWGKDSIFLWIAKHKFDQDHIGCHIVPDKSRMLIYDPEKTRRAAIQYAVAAEAEEMGE